MATMDDWLALAPKPRELKAEHEWHVFLSYRSVHRPWVIQLYDVLRSLGYEVFLDQYVLAASETLISRLEEGLERSASGVLVWSSATEDSEWCRREYETMEARSGSMGDFQYVVAKLDDVELPLFASRHLYVDFSQHRSGPSGVGLLRLLYGLARQPLPDAAIRLATEVDAETRSAQAEIAAALETDDRDRLLELVQRSSLAWVSQPLLCCEVAESLTKLEQYAEALSVLDRVGGLFPKAIRPRQLRGLTLARSGDWRGAQRILGELVACGENDPETLGIYARTWMDRYEQSGDLLHLRKSRDVYARAFMLTPSDCFTGINAAAKSVLLGDVEAAKEFSKSVEEIVGNEKVEGDYWVTATVAEVQLIEGNYSKAADLYEAAVAMAPGERGSHETTWKQARRLMEKLDPSAEDAEKVASVFVHLG